MTVVMHHKTLCVPVCMPGQLEEMVNTRSMCEATHITPHGSSIPCSELKAFVSVSLCFPLTQKYDRIQSAKVMTASTIALQWTLSDHRPYSSNVRNSVLEICRLVNLDQLYHVKLSLNWRTLQQRMLDCLTRHLTPMVCGLALDE